MYAVGVVTVLAAFLVCVGGLFYLISRRLPVSQGLDALAVGGGLLGLAFALQLLFPNRALNPVVVINHSATAASLLCFLSGMQRFLGMRALGWREIALCALGYTVLQVLVDRIWGMTARYVLLAGSSALAYAAIAATQWWGARHRGRDVRVGLLTLAVCAAGVSLLNATKAYRLSVYGIEALHMESSFQKVFYTLIAIAVVVIGPAMVWMVFARLGAQLKQQAVHDPLTGVLNRAGMMESLAQHWRREPHATAVVMMIDIDHFKAINDRYGHPVGDAVLRAVAQVLRENLRQGDFVARTGGEEFIVVCLHASRHSAIALAERLRVAVAQRPLPGEGAAPVRCTVSIGVSQVFSGTTEFDRAVAQADDAMYRVKQAGRNRVGEFGVD